MIEVTKVNDLHVNGLTPIKFGIPHGADGRRSIGVHRTARHEAPPIVDGVSHEARVVPFLVSRRGTTLSAHDFADAVERALQPEHGRVTLLATLSDGATALQAEVYVAWMQQVSDTLFEGELEFVDRMWQATAADAAVTTSPVTNGGSAKAYPTITVTPTTTQLKRVPVTITNPLSRPLADYPVRIGAFNSSAFGALTTADFLYFANGLPQPIWTRNPGNSSTTTVDARVTLPALSSVTHDLYFGPGVPAHWTQQAFIKAGLDPDSGSYSNTNWVWQANGWELSKNPAVPGAWVPAKISVIPSGITFGQVTELTDKVEFRLLTGSGDPEDANGIMLIVGSAAGTSAALTGLVRKITVGTGGGTRLRILFRTAGSARWQVAYGPVSNTVNPPNNEISTAADVDLAVAIAVPFDASSAATVDSLLTLSGTLGLALDSGSVPTVAMGTAVNARYLDAALANTTTGESIDFDQVLLDDVALTIACETGRVSAASGPIRTLGQGILLPASRFPLRVGANAWTALTNANTSWVIRRRFAA